MHQSTVQECLGLKNQREDGHGALRHRNCAISLASRLENVNL